MATWTDGAAYAPIERPDGFATPEAPPLPAAVEAVALTPGAIPPPRDFAPSGPSIPLADIRVRPVSTRNPGEPFAVASGMLSTGAVGRDDPGTRDPRMAFASQSNATNSYEVNGTSLSELPPHPGTLLPPPAGEPLPVPMAGPGGAPYGYPPAPGQAPMWGQAVPGGAPVSQHWTLAGLGAATLVLGSLVPAAAPVLMVIAGALILRTRPLTGPIGAVLIPVGLGLIVISPMIDLAILGPVSRLVSIIAAATLAYAMIRHHRRSQPPRY